MKAEEQVAKDYLELSGFRNVKFEPDGNIPPDFSMENKIGVEVRRLNQNYFGDDEPQGLEELAIPLWKHLKIDLAKFDNQFDDRTYWVSTKFKRPSTESGKETAKSIRNSLEDFLARGGHAPDDLKVNDYLKISVTQSTPVQGKVFRLSGGIDQDSGGWLTTQYVDNISYCIKEKSEKIIPYKDRYFSWWLLLIDFMGWGFNDDEILELSEMIQSLGNFDHVIVIGNQSGELRLDLNKKAA